MITSDFALTLCINKYILLNNSLYRVKEEGKELNRIERFENMSTFMENFDIKEGDRICGRGEVWSRSGNCLRDSSCCPSSTEFIFKAIKNDERGWELKCSSESKFAFSADTDSFFFYRNHHSKCLVICVCREINGKMKFQVCILFDVEVRRG